MNSIFYWTREPIYFCSVPTLYPLKTVENLKFSDVFWWYQIGTLGRNALNTNLWKKLYFCMKGVTICYNLVGIKTCLNWSKWNKYMTLLAGEIFKM